ncbi:hypothetical protein QFZ22_000529 [Streptomyces canus]|uniref:Uncharacterized protein n=1 Tax=Streptomyces canus TaxID=58343 RepID=A0AAW8F433_9ACTN|nr:hypothetical protein [Streptomyces canus]MDQ0904544.1 hypothetical protein [Streptomyces canus]
MADSSSLVSLASGLGGAAIGAGAAIWVAMVQRRHQREEASWSRAELISNMVITQLMSLRTTGWARLDVLLRTQQSLSAGVEVQLEAFDQEASKATLKNVEVSYAVMADAGEEVNRLSAQIFDELLDAQQKIRQQILNRSAGVPCVTEDESAINHQLEQVKQLRTALNAALLERIALEAEMLRGSRRPRSRVGPRGRSGPPPWLTGPPPS